MGQRKSGHVTLTDVASASGFSVSTVSIVLSEAPLSQNITPATRQQIRTIAQQLGYHPDAFARSLRLRRSQTIGVLAYDLSDPYCIPVVRGIQGALEPASYLPLLMDAQSQRTLFDRYLQMILERRAEGVIVIASWVFDETDLLGDVEKNKVPIVILSRDLTDRGVSSVHVDNEAGGALSVEHLLSLGHKKIAVIRGPEQLFDSEPRWQGISRAAQEAGVEIDSRLTFQLEGLTDPLSGFEGGIQFAAEMLASRVPFSAVVAFDDLTALGVIRGLTAAGVRVPEDCSVVGFDDVLPASVSTPSLTTIRQPLEGMGLKAAQWILEAVEARNQQSSFRPRLYKAEPELVARMSTSAKI